MFCRATTRRVIALLAMLILAVCFVLGMSPSRAYASQGTYAMLYSDGALVLQDGTEADPSKGELSATYGPVTNELSSILGDAAATVRSVEFADPFSMSGDVSGFFSGMSSCESIAGFDKVDASGATSVYLMFSKCSSLRSLDLSGLDLSGVAEGGPGGTYHMFSGCSSLESLDLSGWDTSAVTNMSGMFSGCSSLESLDLSGFDVSNVSGDMANGGGMSVMFDGCSSLESLDLSGWDTSSVTSMFHMFTGCSSLASLDLSSFDTSSVTDMSGMFTGCSSLASLDLSSFDTSGVKYMGGVRYGNDGMFEGCSSLESLDLSSFDTSSVLELRRTFVGCSSLREVSLGAGFVFKDSDGALPTPDPASIPGADGRWYAASGSSYAPADVPSGKADTYYAVRSEIPGGGKLVDRIAGDYANQTSAMISSRTFPGGSDWVVLARDDDFADAMSATGLAGALNCPIILTGQYGLSSAAAAEIQRLGAKHAYVIGGWGAMPGDFERDLAELGCTVEQRVFGEYAHDTSVECAKLIAQHGGGADAIVAMGTNFQDALSISSFAYAYKLPIFLTVPWGERGLPASAVDAVRGMAGDIWVPGGPGAVPTSQVEGVFEGRTFHRIYGYDGYETSNAIAHHMIESGLLSAESCVVACGAQGPKGTDALAGAALAGRAKAPVLLVNGNSALGGVDYTTVDAGASDGKEAFMKSESPSIAQVWVLGGAFVMPQETVDRISAVLER